MLALLARFGARVAQRHRLAPPGSGAGEDSVVVDEHHLGPDGADGGLHRQGPAARKCALIVGAFDRSDREGGCADGAPDSAASLVLEQLLDGVGDLGAVLPVQQMQPQVEPRGHPARRDEVTVIDDAGINHPDAGRVEHVEAEPVCDRPAAFQYPGHRESQGTSADCRDHGGRCSGTSPSRYRIALGQAVR